MVSGNIINPYFPNNLFFSGSISSTKFKVGTDFAVAVGGEWYPYNGMELLTNFPVAMAAMLIGYILFMPRERQAAREGDILSRVCLDPACGTVSFETVCRIFSAVRRPFRGVQLAGISCPEQRQLPEDFKREIDPYLDADKKTEKEERIGIVKQAAVWTLGIVLICISSSISWDFNVWHSISRD